MPLKEQIQLTCEHDSYLEDTNHLESLYQSKALDEANFVDAKVDQVRPLIYVDVNIAPGRSERISVFIGDTAADLAEKFAMRHCLNLDMQYKLEKLL